MSPSQQFNLIILNVIDKMTRYLTKALDRLKGQIEKSCANGVECEVAVFRFWMVRATNSTSKFLWCVLFKLHFRARVARLRTSTSLWKQFVPGRTKNYNYFHFISHLGPNNFWFRKWFYSKKWPGSLCYACYAFCRHIVTTITIVTWTLTLNPAGKINGKETSSQSFFENEGKLAYSSSSTSQWLRNSFIIKPGEFSLSVQDEDLTAVDNKWRWS